MHSVILKIAKNTSMTRTTKSAPTHQKLTWMALIWSSQTKLYPKLRAHRRIWNVCKLADSSIWLKRLPKMTDLAWLNKRRVARRSLSTEMKVPQQSDKPVSLANSSLALESLLQSRRRPISLRKTRRTVGTSFPFSTLNSSQVSLIKETERSLMICKRACPSSQM